MDVYLYLRTCRSLKVHNQLELFDVSVILFWVLQETDWEDYNRTGGGSLPSRQSSRRQTSRKQNKTSSFGPREYEKLNRSMY